MAAMDVERMQEHCLAKPGAWSDNPWDHDYPVIKVGEGEHGKIFAFLGSGGVGFKCGPSRDAADDWLEQYPDDVRVMAYIGRSGWNDLSYGGAIPDDELLEAADESYRLVVSAMSAKHRPAGWEAAVAVPEPAAEDDEPETEEIEPEPEDDEPEPDDEESTS
jgi:predicted DNA-binding protein (MmcQ/YjbR family)